MNVLVINCGSSSLKYQLINSDTEDVLAKGLCERIGIDGRLVYQKAGSDKEITECAMPTHKEAIQFVLDALTNDKTGAIKSLKEVDAIGHRIVHGGEKFASSAVITDEMIATVEECNDLAPLHNPANLIGIRVCSELMPGVPQVGVFDTAFHQTMPAKAYLYGLPIEYYKNYKVRRYGFHGTSHSFVSKRAVEFLGLDKDNSKADFLFSTFITPARSRFSFFAMNSTIAGSMLPERVPITTPSSGVRPIVVSTHSPFTTALMEEPFPRWQTITLELSLSRPRNSTARLETKLWDVPWKPYLLTL